MLSFPLRLSLNIEHSLNSKLLFSVSHILYLKVITQGCSLKCMFFNISKFCKPDTLSKDKKHDNDREDQHHRFSDVKLLIGDSTAIHTTM